MSAFHLPLLQRFSQMSRQSIWMRLVGLFTLVIGAIAIFIFLYFPAKLEQQAFDALQAKVTSIGAMAAFSVRSAVVFEDHAAIIEGLGGVLENQDVLYVEVVDPAGGVIASLSAPGSDPGAAAHRVGGVSADGLSYHTATPILLSGQEIGQVHLGVSLEGLRSEIATTKSAIQIMSLVIFLIGLLAANLISRRVSVPLGHILAATDRIGRGELAHRAQVESEDEVGRLAEAFNRMVDRLEEAQATTQASKQKLEQILDHLPAEVALFDMDCRYQYVNPVEITDPELRSGIIGKTPEEFCADVGLDPAVGRVVQDALKQCMTERRLVNIEQEIPGADGESRHFLRVFSPFPGVDGQIAQVIGYALDLTERREAEAALRKSEELLLQAQKMESVGKLAGGIAHDFNNLLTAITGHADLALMEVDSESSLSSDIIEIKKAANRAAALTKQLLAFSRKQVLQPKVLDLNAVVRDIQKMLRRLIGEDVEMTFAFSPEVGHVKIDPGQLQQVLLNLVVNSRDAMPQGGRLAIETGTVDYREGPPEGHVDFEAYRYATLTVTDTGIGMDQATQERIFEPFFTTKDEGKGTGLGLATVYGIIKQSNGRIYVYSEPGIGTMFKIYLPLVDEEADLIDRSEVVGTTAGGAETILLTEDQEGVRNLSRRVLERSGYKLLIAEDSEDALTLAADYPDSIDLLLTDVVMPGKNGAELAQELLRLRPDISILYMSGYTDELLQQRGVLNPGIDLLQKPFSPQELAQAVRRNLDRHQQQLIAAQRRAKAS